jgi:predicted nucleic acid-binding protein
VAGLRRRIAGTLVLDAQGVTKLAAGDAAVRALALNTRQRGGLVVTAASTLAEVLRGGPKDAPVHQALRHVSVASIGKDLGRKAGELLGATGMSGHRDTVDSLLAVVALAQQRPVVLLTSDPADMARLTEEPHRSKAERVAVVQV